MQKKSFQGKIKRSARLDQYISPRQLSGAERRDALEFADFDRGGYRRPLVNCNPVKPWMSQMRYEPLRFPKSFRLSDNQLGIPDQKWRRYIQDLQLKAYQSEIDYQEQRRQRAIERLFEKLHGEHNHEISKK